MHALFSPVEMIVRVCSRGNVQHNDAPTAGGLVCSRMRCITFANTRLHDEEMMKRALITYSLDPSRTLPTVSRSGSNSSASVAFRLGRGGSIKGSLPACAFLSTLSK